jgi:DNA-directed RNA polymerase alpha subunit
METSFAVPPGSVVTITITVTTAGPVVETNTPALNMTMVELDLPPRAETRLEALRVFSVRDLVKLSAADLLNIPGFGRTSLRAVTKRLRELGLSLAPVTLISNEQAD